MYRASYHGYAMTDFYQVDPRFGTLNEYKELADKAQGTRYETGHGSSCESLWK